MVPVVAFKLECLSNYTPAKWWLIMKLKPWSATWNNIPLLLQQSGRTSWWTYSEFPSVVLLGDDRCSSPQRSCDIRGSFIMMAVSWSKATVISGGSGRLRSDALFVLCIWRFISRHNSRFQCSLLVPCCTAWTIFTLCDLLLVSSFGLEWITLKVLQKYVFG